MRSDPPWTKSAKRAKPASAFDYDLSAFQNPYGISLSPVS
jgi:hypothetical protein